jgi:UDP-N-acetyl-D-glucosamine/UDP-N-acetyl-D-galactosamine dehydrogenase
VTARRVSVIGLGYVGLPVAIAFGRRAPVIGFDTEHKRVQQLRQGVDRTGEVDAEAFAQAQVEFTDDSGRLGSADFHIVAVPTPIDSAKQPDFGPLEAASRSVGSILKKGDIVVYESTVYPGATDERCVPVLEAVSGLKAGVDFGIGYSPERINPGDREHRFEAIRKVVSGNDQKTLKIVADVYRQVVDAGVFEAASIAAAEAAKVIENTQRDLNIALMNELAVIFSRLGLDTRDVLAAAGTKWNFLPFEPGLVGGHCIGVDPYYLTHKAIAVGHHPQVILAGRRINDAMGPFVARQVVKALLRSGRGSKQMRVTVLGLSFKDNVADLRNTKVIDVVNELESHGIDVQLHDPLVDEREALAHHGVNLTERGALAAADAVILAVAHDEFVRSGWSIMKELLVDGSGIVFDVRGVLDRAQIPEQITLLRL